MLLLFDAGFILLTFSCIALQTRGKIQLELSAFSLARCVNTILCSFQLGAMKKRLRLVSKISSDTLMNVIGDMHRLTHVISNLVSNAIKFSPEDATITVRIACEGRSTKQPRPLGDDDDATPGGELVTIATLSVSVEDLGPGMSAKKQAMVFRNYFQIRPQALQQETLQLAQVGCNCCPR